MGATAERPKELPPMPLTDVTARNAKPSEKTRRLTDSAGLYLEISPAGGKWWRFKYRFDGKEKRLSLGVYPDISLKEARERRDAARRQVAQGVDPSQHRKATKAAKAVRAANSFEVIGREWFEKNSSTWADTHSSKIIRRLERDIFPWLGGRAIAEITAPEVWPSCAASKGVAPWIPRIVPGRIAAASSAMRSPPDGPNAIPSPICAARCHRPGAATSPRSPTRPG